MPPPALNQVQKARLSSASREEVVAILAKLSGRNNWLSQGTTFPSKLLKKKWPTLTGPDRTQIAELIAVSVPNHCFDGWGFLGRALSALIAGDAHAARHFAYYAELRAALSILASQGVGVFNIYNCAIEKGGNLIEIDHEHGTHTMTWLGLEHWAHMPGSGALVSDSFRVGGITFTDCIQSMWSGGLAPAAARDLILDWGMDLRVFSHDRESRNESSYSPHAVHPVASDAKHALDFVDMFWRCFEPTAPQRFPLLDKHLFRLVCERVAQVVGTTPAQVAKELGSRHAKLDAPVHADVSSAFLAREHPEATDLRLIELARTKSDPSEAVEMISRAALLLRSATALCMKTVGDAGLVATDFHFWMTPFGHNLGFWNHEGPPQALSDLWDDIEVGLETAATIPTKPFCRHAWFSENESGIPRIGEAERIALWGLSA